MPFLRLDCRGYSRGFGLSYGDTFPDSGTGNPQPTDLFLIGLLSVGAIASVSYKEYASFGRNNKQVRYYINTFNYIYAAGRYYKRAMDAGRKFVILDDAPRIVADTERKPRVIVLIVGETARAQNFRFTVTVGKRIRCFQKTRRLLPLVTSVRAEPRRQFLCLVCFRI